MAVGLKFPENIKPVPGVQVGATAAYLRKSGRKDLVLFHFPNGANIAGLFTLNQACAAPVEVAKKHLLDNDVVYAWIVNSGVANAGLGRQGVQDCLDVCSGVAEMLNVASESVLPFSTGVIGKRLPVSQICGHLKECQSDLREDNWLSGAEAIMTTDTIPKAVSRTAELSESSVVLTGIVKGAGMIEPNMATMLSFIATDAAISKEHLKRALGRAVDLSFNRITVDGDTSTNDACVLAATGASEIELSPDVDGNDWNIFCDALNEVTAELAQMLIRDAEGANKFISIEVTGGWREQECLRVGKVVANSPLVKTALFASDPNWGRIFAAIGRSGIEHLDMSLVNIEINGVEILRDGTVSSSYTEEAGVAAMASPEIHIRIDLGMGDSTGKVWTSDLSTEYVRVNADYRT